MPCVGQCLSWRYKGSFAKWHHEVQDGLSVQGRCSGYAQCHILKGRCVRYMSRAVNSNYHGSKSKIAMQILA